MNLRTLASGVAALAVAGFAYANPIVPPSVTLDPLLSESANVTQQVCPRDVAPTACLAAQPTFSSPAGLNFDINILNEGLMSLSIDDVLSPGNGGQFTELRFELWRDGSKIGDGSLGAELNDVEVTAGLYEVFIFWTFDALRDNVSARWSMTIATSPDFNNVPEPSTLALMGLMLTGLAIARRRRQ